LHGITLPESAPLGEQEEIVFSKKTYLPILAIVTTCPLFAFAILGKNSFTVRK
jgi:hypothetical protein